MFIRDQETKDIYKNVNVHTLQEINDEIGYSFVFGDGLLIEIIDERAAK